MICSKIGMSKGEGIGRNLILAEPLRAIRQQNIIMKLNIQSQKLESEFDND